MASPDGDTARRIAAELDLDDCFDRHPMSLSGGQKQRVAIAAAIAAGREIVVFDEPTSGLDLTHMAEVALQLRRMAGKVKVIIVITHDYELIANACSYVLRMEGGEIAEQYPLDAMTLSRRFPRALIP